ncbi:MAG TPA: YggS family pyridoxal phosphate-dependent enzyme [Acidobacteriota bacterium]|nr:YggS family pyridoxal phosphate-dependent enzyme [Acidobacteriota bacterium]
MNVPSTFSERLDAIQSRIHAACARAGRTSDDITLVAVSKTKPVEMLQEAFEAGVRHFGENRVQEAATKIPHLPKAGLTWHLIGHLQSNKAKSAVELFDVIHSVDSIALATRLNRLAGEHNQRVPIFLQVHLGDEESKAGVDPTDLPALFQASCQLPHLNITGLMAIPPYFPDPEQVRPSFVTLRQLRDQLAVQFPDQAPLPFLSMGMSHDFEVAIEEGATHVRVGTALFGGRS